MNSCYRRSVRGLLLGGAAALVISAAQPAFAQAGPSQAGDAQAEIDAYQAQIDALNARIAGLRAQSGLQSQDASSDAGASASPEAAAPAEQAGISEIVVTAERSAQNVQQVPISIVAIQPDALVAQGKSRLVDILSSVAGVAVQKGVYTPSYYVRGVGRENDSAITFTTSLDGIVTMDGLTIDTTYNYDIDRIEVLRGPQGTLYGRNSTAGAMNIVTKDPTDQFEGYLQGTFGNYSLFNLSGALNVPVTDTLAVRFAFGGEKRYGYIRNTGQSDANWMSGRVKVRWTPTAEFDLNLWGGYANSSGTGNGDVLAFYNRPGEYPWHASDRYTGAFPCSEAGDVINGVPQRDEKGYCVQTNQVQERSWNIGGRANYDVGFGTVSVLGGYLDNANLFGDQQRRSTNGQAIGRANPKHVTYQVAEVQIASNPGSAITWVGGFHYDGSNDDQHNWRRNASASGDIPAGLLDSRTIGSTQTMGGFAQVTAKIVDSLRLIAGGRYNVDNRKAKTFTENALNPVPQNPTYFDVTWKKFTYRLGAEYDIAPQNMLYFTRSTGFTQGSTFNDLHCIANGAVVAPLSTAVGGGCPDGSEDTAFTNDVGPDDLVSYELGLKNRFFDNKLQVNIAGFIYNYTTFASGGNGLRGDNTPGSVTIGIEGVKIRGVDLDLIFMPTSRDTFSFAGEYLHSRLGLENGTNPFPNGEPANGLYPGMYPLSPGDTLPQAPTWQANIAYDHEFDFPGGVLDLHLQTHLETKRRLSLQPYYFNTNPGYHLSDLSLTYVSDKLPVDFSLWMKNIENHAVIYGANTAGAPAGIYWTLGAPRTYGATVKGKF